MKRKRLFLFRGISPNDIGLIRAYTIDEACDIVCKYYGKPVTIKSVPREFTFFMPKISWWGEA